MVSEKLASCHFVSLETSGSHDTEPYIGYMSRAIATDLFPEAHGSRSGGSEAPSELRTTLHGLANGSGSSIGFFTFIAATSSAAACRKGGRGLVFSCVWCSIVAF